MPSSPATSKRGSPTPRLLRAAPCHTDDALLRVLAEQHRSISCVRTTTCSPGVITAVVLFLPIGSWAYLGASRDGALDTTAIVTSGVLGFVLMLFPIVLQMTKRKPFFRQEQVPA